MSAHLLRPALYAALAAAVAACASNSALTLMAASRHVAPVIPTQSVVDADIKGRPLELRTVYYGLQTPLRGAGGLNEHAYPALIEQQLHKAMRAARLTRGNAAPVGVDIAIEQLQPVRPALLRVRMELRDADKRLLLRGEFEARAFPPESVAAPGVTKPAPAGMDPLEFQAIAAMIPAVAATCTRVLAGLHAGKTLDRIEVYPETGGIGGVIVPERFLRDKPFGLQPLSADDVGAAAQETRATP